MKSGQALEPITRHAAGGRMTPTEIDPVPDVLRRRTRVGKFYSHPWAATLATGLFPYYVIYVM